MSAGEDEAVSLGLRPDFDRVRIAKNEPRTAERLAVHFDIERRLAGQLAASNKQERSVLYSTLYQQLFASVDDHPQHRSNTKSRQDRIRSQVNFLRGLLKPNSVYVEIGCGDAALTKALAPFVASSIGVDVTSALIQSAETAPSFSFMKTDGVSLDVPPGSADLVYSNQLMEHLHTDDALEQLSNIFRALKPGGRYVCSTPNRLTGPHDISCYFGHEPSGFHMREYDHRSLSQLFRKVGFTHVFANVTVKGLNLNLPIWMTATAEVCFEMLPRNIRTRLALIPAVSNMAGLTLTGTR